MYETSLDKVLNYMKQYVENRFEHDSEPMLNYKDLELVLNYINKQKEVINKIKPMLKELNIKIKDILNIGIDIKEISDILELLEEIE